MKRSLRLRLRVLASLLLVASVASAAPARPKPKPKPPAKPTTTTPNAPAPSPASSAVEVTVAEIAGSQVYIKPGASAGVRRGSRVTIKNREFTVEDASASYAVFAATDKPPAEGDKGSATVVEATEEAVVPLKQPRPASAFAGVWPDAVAPASAQNPEPVPLGERERDRRYDVRFMMLSSGFVPLGSRGDSLVRAELNARVHAEPFRVPLSFDLDGSVQRWFGPGLDARAGGGARPLIRVREAFIRYGALQGTNAGFGRMRYAAGTLGALDGLRARAALGGGFGVAAFGGALPDPLSTDLAFDAQRFGVEATYSAPDRDLRPEAALVVHGSTFGGKLDERRLSGVVGLYPGLSRFGAHVEVSSFDGNNPWGANAVELTAGGVDGSVRLGPVELGGRFDVRQPERSRYLASLLPASWFCLTTPAPVGAPPGPEPCDGRVSNRAQGTVDASVEIDRLRVSTGGTIVRDLTIPKLPSMLGGFASARVVRIARHFRADVTGSYSTATYVDMLGVSGGPGFTAWADQLDFSTYYRFAQIAYAADSTKLTQHGVGGMAMFLPGPTLAFTLQGEAIAGDDAQAMLFFASAMWRPLF